MTKPYSYINDLIPKLEYSGIFERLCSELSWVHASETTPRKEYYWSELGLPYSYGTGIHKREYISQPLHVDIWYIGKLLKDLLGVRFDVCFINRYDSKRDQLGWHADDSIEMSDLHPIVTVSLGAERQIWFRENGKPSEVDKLVLEHGSACIMWPGMQDSYQHRIPKCDVECGTRISLTYRVYSGGIDKPFVDQLYDACYSGIGVLRNVLSSSVLDTINKGIEKQRLTFELKRETYIDNNQTVSLVYRGPFEDATSELKITIFKYVMHLYNCYRCQLEGYSDITFARGTSIEIKLIHYPISDLGVGIHKDLSSNINMITFFNLQGSAIVDTYDDKLGTINHQQHHVQAGDVSIMRGPRLDDVVDIRPYHGVGKVDQPRTVLVIREIDEEVELITNANNWRGF